MNIKNKLVISHISLFKCSTCPYFLPLHFILFFHVFTWDYQLDLNNINYKKKIFDLLVQNVM